MGLFKKIKRGIKKVTKGVSKVLDKVVPNELKPLLPYAAAFAPMMMPATGFMGSMMGRGLMSGGANIFSQLAQEGNEGDINELSALLAGGIGALSAPGASEKLMSARSGELGSQMIQQSPMGPMVSSPTAYMDTSNVGMLGKAKNLGLRGLAKSANFLNEGRDILSPGGVEPGLNMATLAAAGPAISQGTGDVMYQQAVNAERDYKKALADYENGLADGEFATDFGRRAAIISAMTAGQHTEEIIAETLASLGLRDGGRVNAMNGGIMSNQRMNFAGGGMDYMPTEPPMMGNPAVIEKIENMREFNITDPDIEDVTDYKGFYEKQNEPDFGGITEAVEKRPADSMLMGIAKEVGPMLLGLPGMAYLAGKEAYKMYQNLEEEDKDKVIDISKKIINVAEYASPVGLGIKAGRFIKDKMTQGASQGGIMRGYNMGGSVLPQGMEMDYRGGGFIPMGSKERADDVPARVSKNEFVMTADAVRAAGGGSINQGAKKMYEVMNNLEARA